MPKNSVTDSSNLIIAIILAAAGLLAYEGWSAIDRGRAELFFLDVGQGDSVLIRSGSSQIIIDGGPDGQAVARMGHYIPWWDHTIELVILTHPDSDHVNGLADIFERYRIKNFWWSGANASEPELQKVITLAKEQGTLINTVSTGKNVNLSALNLLVLYPFSQSCDGQFPEDPNDCSIIIQARGPGKTALLTGDASKIIESRLLSKIGSLSSDYLKAGHHGSKNSTSAAFLDAVRPVEVIASVGAENRYGHPHPTVIELIENKGIVLRRTDVEGDVVYKEL